MLALARPSGGSAVSDVRGPTTDAGIPVREVYTEGDLASGLAAAAGGARPAAVHARAVSDDVPGSDVDDAPVRRVRFARGRERAVPFPARTGARRRSRSPSTCRRSSGTTPITRWPGRRSGGSASRSTRPTTWSSCSTGLPLDQVSVNFTINATAPIILAMYLVAAERQGVAEASLAGTLQNDILKEFLARKTFVFPPEPSMRLSCDVIEFASGRLPRFNPISITGLPRSRGRLRRDPGAGAHARVGDRVLGRARRPGARLRLVRSAAVVPLRHDDGSVRGGREAARRSPHVGPHRHGSVRRRGPELRTAAVLLGELRHHAHRAAAPQQRRALDDPVPRRGARRRAVDPRDGLRRGATRSRRRKR